MDSMGTNKMKCQIGRWVLIYSAVVFGLFCVAGCQPFLDDDVSLHSYQNARQLNFTPVDFKNLSKQPTFVLRACNINQSFHFFHELTQDCGVAIYCNLKVGDGHSENFYSSADFILTGLFVITIDDKIKDLFIMEPVYGTLNIDKQSGAVEISINRLPADFPASYRNRSFAIFRSFNIAKEHFYDSSCELLSNGEVVNITPGEISFAAKFDYCFAWAENGKRPIHEKAFNYIPFNLPIAKLAR